MERRHAGRGFRDRGGTPLANLRAGQGRVIAIALHAGHLLRPGLEEFIALSDSDRLREEDPHTASMAPDGVPVLEVVRSRFEVDLNRPRERAVYQGPEDAWGMELYRRPLPEQARAASLGVYDDFYAIAHAVLSRVERDHGRFVVLELHSYNHRRKGVHAAPAPLCDNPEVNLGTSRIDLDRWSAVTEAFIRSMTDFGFDCRENVRFRGGHFSQWVGGTFPVTGVSLPIEFKKTYMDEWTGHVDPAAIERIRQGLAAATTLIEKVLSESASQTSGSPARVHRRASLTGRVVRG